MVLIFTLLSLLPTDPAGDLFIVDHLTWQDGIVAEVEFYDHHRWEQEMAEPRAHRMVLRAMLRDETATRKERAVKEELKRRWKEIHRRKFNVI